MSAANMKWGRRGPRYRRRRPIPALIVLSALVVLSGFLWTQVFETSADIEAATRCNPPGPPTGAPKPTKSPDPIELGKMLPRDALDDTTPAPPRDVPVQVLNGNGESMQATMIANELSSLGFAQGASPNNDPVYTNYNLNCHGQIRFGGAGASAARTLSLVSPCAQLVRDGREDASVDLALGANFDDIVATTEAKQVLQDLKSWAPQRDQQGDAAQQISPPQIDNELLTKARDVYC